jgi:hypothetical protein
MDELWSALGLPAAASEVDQVPDSLPIMLAVRGRSLSAEVARGEAELIEQMISRTIIEPLQDSVRSSPNGHYLNHDRATKTRCHEF